MYHNSNNKKLFDILVEQVQESRFCFVHQTPVFIHLGDGFATVNLASGNDEHSYGK